VTPIYRQKGGDDEAAPEDELEGLVREAIARKDREGAITLLVRRAGPEVYRYCRKIIGEDAEAADAYQVTFVQAYKGLDGFAGRGPVVAWLMGIARHRALDRLRVLKREATKAVTLEGIDPAAPGSPAEARVTALDVGTAIDDCLDRLDARSRAAVVLRLHDGLAYDEIQELTGDTVGALRVRVTRALPLLRRCLEAKGVAPDGV
jgi:RNA polymerase sigma-70 factor (ECF subfamily)